VCLVRNKSSRQSYRKQMPRSMQENEALNKNIINRRVLLVNSSLKFVQTIMWTTEIMYRHTVVSRVLYTNSLKSFFWFCVKKFNPVIITLRWAIHKLHKQWFGMNKHSLVTSIPSWLKLKRQKYYWFQTSQIVLHPFHVFCLQLCNKAMSAYFFH